MRKLRAALIVFLLMGFNLPLAEAEPHGLPHSLCGNGPHYQETSPYRPETDEKIKDLLRTRALKYLKQQDVSRYTWLATSSDFEENIGKRDDRYGNEIYELSWVGGAGCKLKRENTAQEGRWWNLKADERCKLVDRVTIYFSNPSLDPWRLEYTSVSGGGNSDCDSIKLAK